MAEKKVKVVRATTTAKKPRPDQWDDFWYSNPILPTSASGVSITEVTAMNYTAVLACVKVLSETISSLPLFVYRKVGEGRERAGNYFLYPLLHDAPNPRNEFDAV
jgi:phage portal protein BeeE